MKPYVALWSGVPHRPSSPSWTHGAVGTAGSPGLVVPQVPSSPSWTQTISVAVRMSPAWVARSPTGPVVSSVIAATPLASVVAPPTAAPWTGWVVASGCFSVTATLNGAPRCAVAGAWRYIGLSPAPDSGSGANSTSSPCASSSGHAPLPNPPLTNSPQ